MGLTITSIDQLDPDLVTQLQAEFSQLIQEKYPEIELTRGVFHDLVSHFSGGISGGINQDAINRVLRSRSLLALEQDPSLDDAEGTLVDHVISNYRVVRKAGVAASGEITIVISEDVTTVIPAGSTFVASGVDFVVDSAFTAQPTDGDLTTPTDRPLTALGDGTFSFTVTATADVLGEQGNIRRGTRMSPTAPPPNYVTSYASTDFIDGRDTELNSELLERLNLGVAAKVMQGRTNIQALIKEQTLFADTLNYSIIGYGNPEMLRDQHWIFPVSGGGRIDIYARTRGLPRSIAVLKTATLVDLTAAGSVWQFAVGKNEVPGFYEIEQIRKPEDAEDSGTFRVTVDNRGFDLSGSNVLPDLVNSVEAAYTRYQTAVIRFLDTETPQGPLTVGDRAEYLVSFRVMPLIAELQSFCLQSGLRNLMADTAVKAAIPCFLSINFDIQQSATSTTPDVDAIKNALADEINALGFPGQIHASFVSDVVHNFLQDRQALGRIEMHGRIRRPNGQNQIIRAIDVLRIPNDPGNLVTGSTTAFILDPRNIGISVVTDGFTQEV